MQPCVPHRGSMQFWPRKRSKHVVARVRTWVSEKKAKPLGFIAYKAGMTHLLVEDNYAKSLTKGEQVARAVTILECPPLSVIGVSFYRKSILGWKKLGQVLAKNVSKEVLRCSPLPKNNTKTIESITEFDDLRLLVQSHPEKTANGAKKPHLLEVALGGSKEEKLAYAKENLGKEISISSVFTNGSLIDVKGITIGKGFQSTVKRFGTPLRHHKTEKSRRGIGTLGPWHPNRILYTVAQPGKMGFHTRTEYNKQILKIGDNGQDVTPQSGIQRYGQVRNSYLLVKGSVVGPRKRAVILTPALRPFKKLAKEAPEITYISK